jgi:hypothetical protein
MASPIGLRSPTSRPLRHSSRRRRITTCSWRGADFPDNEKLFLILVSLITQRSDLCITDYGQNTGTERTQHGYNMIHMGNLSVYGPDPESVSFLFMMFSGVTGD